MSIGPLALFFTRGVSLAVWEEEGILDRELALYRALAPELSGVELITYGDRSELRYAPQLEGMQVHPNRRGLPMRLYGQLLPLMHRAALRRAGVLKTNQVYGGIAALRSARLYRRPLIARCGFLWSEFVEKEHGEHSLRARHAATRERQLFMGAAVVVVTTARLKQRVVERHAIHPERIAVVPNYVDTTRFGPRPEAREAGSLLFVGRLSRQKNLAALLEALAGLDDASLTVVGDGPERGQLERLATRLGVDVRFAGRVPHERLPELLGRADAFVMPSLYEGHPKALIEAMACGLPVVGSDVDGIREVVRHGETGLLCRPHPPELRGAIETLLGDSALRTALGRAAREAAQEMSLERVAELELEVIGRAAGSGPGR